MFIGYRTGFMARPYGYHDSGYSYQQEHKGENYNKREDGNIECAVADSIVYIEVRP